MDGRRRSSRNADRSAKARKDLEEDMKGELKEVENVYDVVDDEEYSKIVNERRGKGQFVVNDKSGGDYNHEYFDNGEDDFGIDEEPEQNLIYQDGTLSKKYLKKGEAMAKENLGSIRGRIDKAFFSKGKDFASIRKEPDVTHLKGKNPILDDAAMDDFLNFDEDGETPISIERSEPQKRSYEDVREVTHASKKIEMVIKSDDDYGEMPEMDMDFGDNNETCIGDQTLSLSAADGYVSSQHGSIPCVDNTQVLTSRDLRTEYDQMNSLPPSHTLLQPPETSMDDDEILALLAEDDTPLKTMKPGIIFDSKSLENEENIDAIMKSLDDDEALKLLLAQPMDSDVKTVTSESSESLLMRSSDGVTFLRFFMTELFEEPNSAPGKLYLFGKVPFMSSDRSGKVDRYDSVCIVIDNISHNLFFLPKSGVDTADVKREVFQLTSGMVKSTTEIGFRIERKKYAFEIEGIPTEETDYVHMIYPGKYPVFPQESGNTFQHVFGRRTPVTESFILGSGLMGPQWLEIRNIRVSLSKKSTCSHEFELDDMVNNVTILPDLPCLPLKGLSLSFATVTLADSNQSVVCGVSVSVYEALSSDSAMSDTSEKPSRSCCVGGDMWCDEQLLCPVVPFPIQFKQECQKEGLRPRLLDTEASLLNMLFDIINKEDPDVILGHNIIGLDLPVLQSRIMRHRLAWGRLGRLRRSLQFPKVSPKELCHVLFCGRLTVDSYTSAKELTKEDDYSLSALTKKYAGVNVMEYESQHVLYDIICYSQITMLFSDKIRLCSLVKSLVFNANAVTQLSLKLQILPLTHQIACISGNTWNRCLRPNRSERVEYYLLHGFTRRNFIVPDKELFKEKWGKRKSKYEGGLVLEPKASLYDDLILVLDFNSLYPSIIQEYNLCYTTVDRDKIPDVTEEEKKTKKEEKKEEKMEEKMDEDGDVVISEDSEIPLPTLPRTVEENELAPLPEMIRYLVKKRREVKSILKTESDAMKRKQLDIKQLALKILANSMYGCLGFDNSRFCATAIASLVTSTGRYILHNTVTIAEKAGFTVVYGDTDSIMVNTATRDYKEALKVGETLMKEVNKRYKYLQIDIDYIFKKMLLLKKKKYAALKIMGTDGTKLNTELEVKGIDLVRRDWSVLSKTAGMMFIRTLFSDVSRDDIRVKIGEYLRNLSNSMRDGSLPLSQFVITKSLTHALKDYDLKNNGNNPHVAVALRMQSTGQIMNNAGDFIRYIICASTDPNHPLPSSNMSDRAFSIAEIQSSNGALKPDIEWYLRNQLLPTLSRLVSPLEDISRSYLCDCLGLESHDTVIEGDAMDSLDYQSSFIPRVMRTDYDVLYAKADPIYVNCAVCKKQQVFKGLLPHSVNCVGEICECGALFPLEYIGNSLITYARTGITKYFMNERICSESGCSFHTNRLNLEDNRCDNMMCQGRVVRVFTASQLYNDICYAIASVSDPSKKVSDEDSKYDPVIAELKAILNRLEYQFVSVDIFKN